MPAPRASVIGCRAPRAHDPTATGRRTPDGPRASGESASPGLRGRGCGRSRGRRPRTPTPASSSSWSVRRFGGDVEVAREHDDVLGLRRRRWRTTRPGSSSASASRTVGGEARAVQCSRRGTSGRPRSARRNACTMRRSFAQARRATGPSSSAFACASRNRRGFSVSVTCASTRRRGETRIAVSLTRERRAEQTVVQVGEPAAEPTRDRQRAEPRPGGDVAGGEAAERPRRHLLQRRGRRVVGGRELGASRRGTRPLRRDAVAVEEVPAADEHATTLLRVRVAARRSAGVHALVRPRARGRARARGRRRRARDVAGSASATLPAPDGYRRQRALLPALVSALQALAAAPAAEGRRAPRGDARRSPRARADVLHLQWLALPQADVHLRFRSPSVFTAHDLLPRRTASRHDLWRRLLARFDRVVVHSERGRADARRAWESTRASSRTRSSERRDPRRRRRDDARARRDPPVQGAPRRDRGDAAAAGRAPARRGRPGDAAGRASRCRAGRVAARLPRRQPSSTARSRESTVAVFPYRAELDQSGALLAGARRRRPRGRLRRRRSRRAGPRVTAPAGSSRRATSRR